MYIPDTNAPPILTNTQAKIIPPAIVNISSLLKRECHQVTQPEKETTDTTSPQHKG